MTVDRTMAGQPAYTLVPDGSASVLGVRVDPGTKRQWINLISFAVMKHHPATLLALNLHNLHCIQQDQRVQDAYDNATAVMVDGWPIAWLADCSLKQRVAWLDALPDLCALAERMGWRIYHVGNEPGVFGRARHKLLQQFPDLELVGQHGHFDHATESALTIELINGFQPHIVTVGMGMPAEALWIAEHRDRIQAPVVIQIGATLDYLAGDLPTPPRWLGPLGLEWLFRLATSPRRTWRRYLIEPWQVLRYARKGDMP